MKPDIDLNSTEFKVIKEFFDKETENAFKAENIVSNAVIPLYEIPSTRGHLEKKKKYEQIASGVLVKIKSHFFIFTANHAFDGNEENAIATGDGKGGEIKRYNGRRYFTSLKSNLDKYDASVYHIEDDLPESLKKIAITKKNFDLVENDENRPFYIISGFRVRDSNTSGLRVDSKRKSMSSLEMNLEDYKLFDFTKNSHILLGYEDQEIKDGKWKTTPLPRGMSGGAVIKIKGTNTARVIQGEREFIQQLTAITIEQYREEHNRPGVLVATRIKKHLELIDRYVPDLKGKF